MANNANTTIRLLCWNIHSGRNSLEKFERAIATHHPDILALQEVSIEYQSLLEETGWITFAATDFYESGKKYNLVTAVKERHRASGKSIEINGQTKRKLSCLSKKMKWEECVECLIVNIKPHNKKISIINIHLSAGESPTQRQLELDNILEYSNQYRKCIIVGDLNCISKPGISVLLGPLANFSLGDYFINERKTLIRKLSRLGYRNHVCGITFPRFFQQLDFAFARQVEVRSASVSKHLYGSDHKPLMIEFLAE